MNIIKIMLYCSVIACCGLIGWKFSCKFQIRSDEVLAIKSRLATLESQIVFFQSPISQALKRAATEENKLIDQILLTVNHELMTNNGSKSFYVIWTEVILDIGKKSLLKSPEMKPLMQLGEIIENTNHDQQEKGFKLVNELISHQYEQIEEERQRNQRLYLKLSLLTGIALVICLI